MSLTELQSEAPTEETEYVFLPLTGPQVSLRWAELQHAILAGTGDFELEEAMAARLLNAILSGKLVVWIVAPAEDQKKILVVFTTTVGYDEITGHRTYIIYTIYAGPEGTVPEMWTEGFKVLKAHAKREKCQRIVGYTASRSIRKTVKELGGRAEQVMIELDVHDG